MCNLLRKIFFKNGRFAGNWICALLNLHRTSLCTPPVYMRTTCAKVSQPGYAMENDAAIYVIKEKKPVLGIQNRKWTSKIIPFVWETWIIVLPNAYQSPFDTKILTLWGSQNVFLKKIFRTSALFEVSKTSESENRNKNDLKACETESAPLFSQDGYS